MSRREKPASRSGIVASGWHGQDSFECRSSPGGRLAAVSGWRRGHGSSAEESNETEEAAQPLRRGRSKGRVTETIHTGRVFLRFWSAEQARQLDGNEGGDTPVYGYCIAYQARPISALGPSDVVEG